MRYINIDGFKPDTAWLVRADQLTKELLEAKTESTRKLTIDKNEKVWQEMEEVLRPLFHGKCWYSEAIDHINNYHVDHFRPKGEVLDLADNSYEGYWWLAFTWSNYRLACGRLNSKKKSYFPVRGNRWVISHADDLDTESPHFLDPLAKDDPGLLSFDSSGAAISTPGNGDWDKERAEVTIKYYNLNVAPLKRARKEKWAKCCLKVTNTINLINRIQNKDSTRDRYSIEKNIEQLREMVSLESEFSAVALSNFLSDQTPAYLRNRIVT
jgi:uncharacterized protein (TIGR02646 family)